MKISVLIPSLNRKEVLSDLLLQLREDSKDVQVDLEVIVIDDRSTDGTSDLVRTRFPEFQLLRGPGISLRAARRFGIENSTGDYIVFLDDDSMPQPGWINNVLPALRRGEKIVQTKLVFIDQGQENVHDETRKNFYTGFRWDMMPVAILNGGYRNQYIASCHEFGCFVAREVLMRVPFDDPNWLGDFGESASFFLRAGKLGFKIFFEPSAIILHLGSMAGGCKERDKKESPKRNCNESAIGMVHNFMLLARMHKPKRIPFLIPYYVMGSAYLSLRQRKNCMKYFVKGLYLGLSKRFVPVIPYSIRSTS